ncbi:MAG: hypothetical protein N2A40_06075, partial [Desulfobulbaceae bacterium]
MFLFSVVIPGVHARDTEKRYFFPIKWYKYSYFLLNNMIHDTLFYKEYQPERCELKDVSFFTFPLCLVLNFDTIIVMKRKNAKTLALIF